MNESSDKSKPVVRAYSLEESVTHVIDDIETLREKDIDLPKNVFEYMLPFILDAHRFRKGNLTITFTENEDESDKFLLTFYFPDKSRNLEVKFDFKEKHYCTYLTCCVSSEEEEYFSIYYQDPFIDLLRM